MGDTECPGCGDSYERLAQHWAMSADCSYPPLDRRRHEILSGLLMGDATVHNPPSAANPRMEVHSVNSRFLEWIDEQLAWLSNTVTLRRTSDEIREANRSSALERFASVDYEIRDQYLLTTRRHTELNRYAEWYTEEQKRFPEDLRLQPITLKLWYVCDGNLLWGTKGHTRPQVWISAYNEKDREAFVRGLFDPTPITPTFHEGRLMLTSDETEWFFEYVGEPVPGFEYKFETGSKEMYEELKEAFYRRHTTTNAA
jgi:hypothetical protein